MQVHLGKFDRFPVREAASPFNPVDSKISDLRNRVFQAIRTHIPLETLFVPERRIDLRVFVEDQTRFYRIAEILSGFKGEVNLESVARHFENSEILEEIKKFVDPNLIFEACADVLNGNKVPIMLKQALEGRIYTMKNAQRAMQNPEMILKSQQDNKLQAQSLKDILREGASFLRESIGIYFLLLKEQKKSIFRDELKNTVLQLLPFTRRITKSFLQEHKQECPENPLTFRNRKGYNRHGLVAATVLEACLNALGFKTRLMGRCDLEPRVTLATTHNLIEVIGSDQIRYLVDPSYIQFHKDLGIEERNLPNDPALILAENEVEAYVEKYIMSHWRRIRELFLSEDDNEAIIDRIIASDQHILYSFDLAELSKEILPEHMEKWAKDGFLRVWNLSGYCPIQADPSFQSIFYGNANADATCKLVHLMGIGPLTNRVAESEIEKRLDMNPEHPISLLAQLSYKKRRQYISHLDIDPRLQVIPSLNAYFRSLKKLVNPESKDLRAIYGCSGGDCSSILLATDASDLIFVDVDELSYDDLNKKKNTANFSKMSEYSSFIYERTNHMGRVSLFEKGHHHITDSALKILFDLKELGVDLKKLKIVQQDTGVRLEFEWKYYGCLNPRRRTITFYKADITRPDTYPELLKEGFDIFYMKGAYFAPKSYNKFLPFLAKSLKPGGWLMTTDKTFLMESCNPEECLQLCGYNFANKKSDETTQLEELMQPPYQYEPFAEIPSILNFPGNKRFNRNPGIDLTYWAILNLRQKLE